MNLTERHKQLLIQSLSQSDAKRLLGDSIKFYKVIIKGEEQWLTTSDNISEVFSLNNKRTPSYKASTTNRIGLKELTYKFRGKDLHKFKQLVGKTRSCEVIWAFTPKAVIYIALSIRDNTFGKQVYEQLIDLIDIKPKSKQEFKVLDSLLEQCISNKVNY
jgi:hypothetical protein